MGRFLALVVVAVVTMVASAQSAPQPASTRQPDTTSTVASSGRQVDVDVAVDDREGKPVRGLRAGSFHLSEDKIPQTILRMNEHSALMPAGATGKLPTQPPGTFTNFTPMAPDGTLNILLIDALNTPTKEQNFIRTQLQEYVKQANPATHIAIFGLADRLILLQGFTSDPKTLQDVVDHKLIPRSSSLLNNRSGDQAPQQSAVDATAPSMAQIAANLQQFEMALGSMETTLRPQLTLDALNTLAHYLATLPGRKNLIWFAGSFPLNLSASLAPQKPASASDVDAVELRQTVRLLAQGRVAIYPVNAPVDAQAPMPHDAGDIARDTGHAASDLLAADTGGRLFYHPSSLADAVAKAIDAGANYYTLIYRSTDTKQDGGYRKVSVDMNNAEPGLQLFYRRGYYADEPEPQATDAIAATTAKELAAAYGRAAMSRGEPTPQDLLFKVRVLPASNAEESSVAPGNALDASVSPKGPFRRYDVDIAMLPNELTYTVKPDGRHAGEVQFMAYVFDGSGRLLNGTGKSYVLNLPPETYARLLHGAIECHLEVSAPDNVATYLRIGVEDVPSNHFGAVEVPVSDVSHLAPPVYQTAPSAAPATTPSTPPAHGAAPQPGPPS